MMNKMLMFMIILAIVVSMPVSAVTIVHWDFDDAGAGDDITMPGNGERADLDSDGGMDMDDWRLSAVDKSGNGNHLTAWTSDWMDWDSTSLKGDYSMRVTDNWGNHWPDARTDSTYNPDIQDAGYAGIDAETITPAAWTVEVLMNVTGANWDSNNQTFVGRDGRNTGGVTSSAATLYFSFRSNDTQLAIDYRDVTGVTHNLEVPFTPTYDTWYHMAATSDGTWLRLYVDEVEIGNLDMTGTSTDTALGLGDTSQWTVACGQWAGGAVDRFNGLIDEVAISDVALAPGSFVCLSDPLAAYDGYATPLNVDGSVGTLVGNDVQVTLNFNAGSDPDPTEYPVNPDILTHYIYLSAGGEDPNLFYNGYVDQVHDPDPMLTDPANSYVVPSLLANGTFYYWQVEEGIDDGTGTAYPAGNPNNIVGPVWSFTTIATVPTILSGPTSVVADSDGNASFTVVGSATAETFEWYKVGNATPLEDGGIYSDTDTPTLVITGATAGDEGQFYCIAYNGLTPSTPSASAQLWTQRLIAQYKFEDNLNDEVGDWPGVYVDPNVLNPAPTAVYYTPVGDANTVDGKALVLEEDPLHVAITGSGDFFNFYVNSFTLNAWVKTTETTWGAMFAKQATDPTRGFILTHAGAEGIVTLRQSFNDLYATGSVVNDDQWHMVTGTYDAATGVGSIYVDGALVNTATNTTVVNSNPSDAVLGAENSAGAVPYSGLLDEVSVYSYAIDAWDVAALYVANRPDATICVENPEYDISGPEDTPDCVVDVYDVAQYAQTWLSCGAYPGCE